MTIEPITRQVWCDAAEEYEDTHELVGFEVRDDKTGAVLGFGETRAEALAAAQSFLLLPTRRMTRAV